MAMTDTLPGLTADAPLARPKRRWGAALKALRRLLAKGDTGRCSRS